MFRPVYFRCSSPMRDSSLFSIHHWCLSSMSVCLWVLWKGERKEKWHLVDRITKPPLSKITHSPLTSYLQSQILRLDFFFQKISKSMIFFHGAEPESRHAKYIDILPVHWTLTFYRHVFTYTTFTRLHRQHYLYAMIKIHLALQSALRYH